MQTTTAAATALEADRMGGEANRLSGAFAGASEGFHTAQAALTEAHGRAEQLTGLLKREQAARADAVGRRALEAEARAAKAGQQALWTARELASANTVIQAGQARLESAARELDYAKKATADVRSVATKAGEEAAELRGRIAGTRKPAVK